MRLTNDIHSCSCRVGSNEIPIVVAQSDSRKKCYCCCYLYSCPDYQRDGVAHHVSTSDSDNVSHNDLSHRSNIKHNYCHPNRSKLCAVSLSYSIIVVIVCLSTTNPVQSNQYNNVTINLSTRTSHWLPNYQAPNYLSNSTILENLRNVSHKVRRDVNSYWSADLLSESSKVSVVKSLTSSNAKTSPARRVKAKRDVAKVRQQTSSIRSQSNWYDGDTPAAINNDWSSSVKTSAPSSLSTRPNVSRFRRTNQRQSRPQQTLAKGYASASDYSLAQQLQQHQQPAAILTVTARPLSRSTRQQVAPPAPMAQALVANDINNKCALILKRTYVNAATNANVISEDGDNETDGLRGFEPTGRQDTICITYEDVNQAITDAKRRRRFGTVPSNEIDSVEPSVPVIAELGELNQETTKILAKRFDLSNDEILNGLPLIDMSRTDFWQICPLMVKQVQCDPMGRFRSFTGHCNNLDQPHWGAAQTPFVRYLAPKHPDGIQADRVSALDGSPLPSPRLITSMVHRDHDQPSGDLSLLIMVWGQIVDHDIALAAPPRDEQGLDFNCCKRQHPNCKPIQIPDDDPFYSRHGQQCMDFKRSLAGLRPNCALGPRVHINTITSTLDANTIYGSTKAIADQLRTFSGGELKVQNVFANIGLKPLLPKQLDRPDLDCFGRPNEDTYCFLGGDERVNEQPTLTALHTLYVRDHNRIAKQLAQLNQHWDDDRIYHETRHIEAAIVQHILISEYLPLLIGNEMMVKYNLTAAPPNTYWNGYDPKVTPSISQGFSTAAFRQGHTFIQGKVRFHDSRTHEFIGSMNLRGLFKRPFHYYKPGRMDEVIAGILNTPAQVYDPFVTEEISGHLFQEPGEMFGMDLPAINLARGREQGVPGYNAFRKWCGLGAVKSFAELQPLMANRTAFLYSKLYKHVDDIDLWSAGISERRMPGSQIGPTFACIIARQFANIKRGDRFWFENSRFPSAFTFDQLREIKKATQARLLCYNSDNLLTIQQNALKLPHPIYNPRIRCSDVPDLDLTYWRENPTKPGLFFTSS